MSFTQTSHLGLWTFLSNYPRASKLRSRLFALGCVKEEKTSSDQTYLSVTIGIKLLKEFMKNKELQLVESEEYVSKVS